MQEVLNALTEQHAELQGLVSGLDEAGFSKPSRCEGWSVADVLLHLAQTDEMAVASLEGNLGEVAAGFPAASSVDEGAALWVEQERTDGGGALARWSASSGRLRELAAGVGGSDRVQWVLGDMSARTLLTTRLAECWIHTGDVAAGLGVDVEPADRLWHIARLAWRTLPHAFAREGRAMTGPVAFELKAPSGDVWAWADDGAVTTIRGSAVELCQVASRRTPWRETSLSGDGPDVEAVLDVVRTWA